MTANVFATHMAKKAARTEAALRIISDAYGISIPELKSPEMQEQHRVPRAVAAYVLSNRLDLQFKEVQTILRMVPWDVYQGIKHTEGLRATDVNVCKTLEVFMTKAWEPTEETYATPTVRPQAEAPSTETKAAPAEKKYTQTELDMLATVVIRAVQETLSVGRNDLSSSSTFPGFIRARTCVTYFIREISEKEYGFKEIGALMSRSEQTASIQYATAKKALEGKAGNEDLRNDLRMVADYLLEFEMN